MREFLKDGKANFVDSKDVLVGFDNSQDCCENFGWVYTEILPVETSKLRGGKGTPPTNLEAFSFDPDFFQTIHDSKQDCSTAVFKLSDGMRTVYLCLYNSHNGYYSHGFRMEVGGNKIREGSL